MIFVSVTDNGVAIRGYDVEVGMEARVDDGTGVGVSVHVRSGADVANGSISVGDAGGIAGMVDTPVAVTAGCWLDAGSLAVLQATSVSRPKAIEVNTTRADLCLIIVTPEFGRRTGSSV
jgi:hypothetical protein